DGEVDSPRVDGERLAEGDQGERQDGRRAHVERAGPREEGGLEEVKRGRKPDEVQVGHDGDDVDPAHESKQLTLGRPARARVEAGRGGRFAQASASARPRPPTAAAMIRSSVRSAPASRARIVPSWSTTTWSAMLASSAASVE